jgi:hypothetical protein
MIIPLPSKTDLGPAAKALVEKIASAIGTLYEPLKKLIDAKVEVEEGKIRAVGKIEISELQKRTIDRLLGEEQRKQERLESVYGKTFSLLEPDADPTKVDDDFIVYHSEKARLISDGEMQQLWANVLAGEVNMPGSFSKRTIDFLSVLQKQEAHLFTSLCGFVVLDLDVPTPVILDDRAPIYGHHGLGYQSLSHLESIGLIRFHRLTGWHRGFSDEQVMLDYFGDRRSFKLIRDQTGRPILRYGKVEFTTTGEQLFRIAGAAPVTDFWAYTQGVWQTMGIQPLTLT